MSYSPPEHFPLHPLYTIDEEDEVMAEPNQTPPPSYRSNSPISDALVNAQIEADVHHQNESLHGDSF